MLSVGIMQPYLFPYLGYFQLADVSDVFILYDDANYIKQGFINRNTILCSGQVQRFTLSVNEASSFRKIKSLTFSDNVRKCLKQIYQAYSKKAFFDAVYPIVERTLCQTERHITAVCSTMLEEIFSYLNIRKNIILSSQIDYDRTASASEKIIAMCHELNANCYINSAGGMALYQKDEFARAGLELKFIKMDDITYFQGVEPFQPNLSVIDVLMNCSPEQVHQLLTKYQFV